MFARKCDRCGKLYENYLDENGSAIYIFNRDDTGQAYENQVFVKDLCPDCMRQFHNFMDGWEPVQFFEADLSEAENERFKDYEELGRTSDMI